MQIEVIDWVIIGIYLVALVTIGVVAARKVKDTSHYFLGGRRFGKLLMIAKLRSRHSRRHAGKSGRRGLHRWDFRDLVPVEESVRHAVLLDHGSCPAQG
jgi:hypothetical protein